MSGVDRFNQRADLALAKQGVLTDKELLSIDDLRDAWNAQSDAFNSWDELGIDEIIWFAQQQAIARYACPAIQPVPVTERLPGVSHTRFEFSVFNGEYEEQAGGSAPTYDEALKYGLHYLSAYSPDGPHSLEVRRVEVLDPHSLPAPTQPT